MNLRTAKKISRLHIIHRQDRWSRRQIDIAMNLWYWRRFARRGQVSKGAW